MKEQPTSTCQRCQSAFQCKADDIANCQCATVTISQATKAYLRTTNYGCLCKDCLVKIDKQAGKIPSIHNKKQHTLR